MSLFVKIKNHLRQNLTCRLKKKKTRCDRKYSHNEISITKTFYSMQSITAQFIEPNNASRQNEMWMWMWWMRQHHSCNQCKSENSHLKMVSWQFNRVDLRSHRLNAIYFWWWIVCENQPFYESIISQCSWKSFVENLMWIVRSRWQHTRIRMHRHTSIRCDECMHEQANTFRHRWANKRC